MSSNENVKKNDNNFIDNVKQITYPAYEGLDILGKYYNIFKSVIVLIIFTIVFIIGYILIKAYNNKEKITGKFSDISCNSTRTKDNKIQYNCDGYVKYYINNELKTKNYSVPYTINNNQEVDVYYNKSNVEDIIISNNKYYIGICMMGLSMFIILTTIIWTILSFKYKPIGALSGIGAIRDILR
jgi:hypothetical protein